MKNWSLMRSVECCCLSIIKIKKMVEKYYLTMCPYSRELIIVREHSQLNISFGIYNDMCVCVRIEPRLIYPVIRRRRTTPF